MFHKVHSNIDWCVKTLTDAQKGPCVELRSPIKITTITLNKENDIGDKTFR